MKDYITFLKFNSESSGELVEMVDICIQEKKKTFIVTPNLDILRISYKDSAYRELLNCADFSLIDGKPILWLSKQNKRKEFKHKISGSDFSNMLLQLANNKEYSITLFGGKENVALNAAKRIHELYPKVRINLALCPEYGYELNDVVCKSYVDKINQADSDIVFLCTGSPKTEKFYEKYKSMFNDSVYLSVGATIDFWAGTVKRAPKWMSNCGLEWLYRLIKDFKRLFKRYFLDFLFLIKIYFIIKFNNKKIISLCEE